MSDPSTEAGEALKIKQDEPTMVCAAATDQICGGMFAMDSSTLKNISEERAPDCHR
jgi:hypothetical protein